VEQATEMTPKQDSAERRQTDRHDVPGLVEVEIEMFGYQRDGRQFGIGTTPDASYKIHTFGRTVNLSLGGMLARVADAISEGSHCLVRFINAGEGIRPELRWGMAMRCEEVEPGTFEIAVRFDSALERLDVDALTAA
jgi:hypothetical protein